MLKQATHNLLRQNVLAHRSLAARRYLATVPPAHRRRSWKSSAVRWGLAIGLVYWYNTSNLFAEEATFPLTNPPSPSEETALPTIDSVARARRKQCSRAQAPSDRPNESPSTDTQQISPADATVPLARNISETEEEASQEGAFNEETGEINWDCPCLGGMAYGPCGEAFRAAFSCFVYSKEEPKGMDCIDNFKTMQDCFRDHPDVYGAELEPDSDEEVEAEIAAQIAAEKEKEKSTAAAVASASSNAPTSEDKAKSAREPAKSPQPNRNQNELKETSFPKAADIKDHAIAAKEQVKEQVKQTFSQPEVEVEEEALVPKAAHDAR